MRGSCNCQNVRFNCSGDISRLSMCHCGQCRKQSGGVWTSAVIEESEIAISGTVKWYQSSPEAKRGFCPDCGAFLFWKHKDESTISFSLGAVDGPTGRTLEKHIYVGDKGDYYQIADGVPQEEN